MSRWSKKHIHTINRVIVSKYLLVIIEISDFINKNYKNKSNVKVAVIILILVCNIKVVKRVANQNKQFSLMHNRKLKN
jgi:hypothetical protein